MYVVKLKYKHSNTIMYANNNWVEERDKIRNSEYISLSSYTMSLNKAKELYKELVFRYSGTSDWYEDKDLDYIAIVELSNYAPYSEYEVKEYKEFK